MTKTKPTSDFHKGTAIPNALMDELIQKLPAMPTQGDLFGPEGVITCCVCRHIILPAILLCLFFFKIFIDEDLYYENIEKMQAKRANK